MYWLPQELFTNQIVKNQFIRSIPKNYGIGFSESGTLENQTMVIERPVGYPSLNYSQNDYELDKMIQAMDKHGIEKGLLKLPGCQEWLTLELCKVFNECAYEFIKASNGRLKALAVVPPIADEDTISELKRAIYEFGFEGIQLTSHYGDNYLDHDQFRPFFKIINEMNVPVYVHHTPVPVEHNSIYEYNNLRRSLGRSIEQNIAIGREIFSDMFETLPNLKFIHSMLGGSFYAFVSQLLPNSKSNDRFDNQSEKYRGYLNNNIYFELSHSQPWGKEQLECAVKVLGADKIIYGSSYPVNNEWFSKGSEFVENLNISDKDKEQILCKNAQNIYNI